MYCRSRNEAVSVHRNRRVYAYTLSVWLWGAEYSSSADFAEHVVKRFNRRGITIECIQTDNGFEFTNRFSPAKKDKPTLFKSTLERLGVKHKLIRPYTPRHNGKVERSHREDHNKFYSCHSFFSCSDLNAQLAARLGQSNNLPMRPLGWLSPIDFFKILSNIIDKLTF